MLRALLLSLGQPGDPALPKVLAKSLALTIPYFLIGGFTVYGLLILLQIWWFDWFGSGESGVLAAVVASIVVTMAVSVILPFSVSLMFRAVAMGSSASSPMRSSMRSSENIIRIRPNRCRSQAMPIGFVPGWHRRAGRSAGTCSSCCSASSCRSTAACS